MTDTLHDFAPALVAWHRRHGRHDLPWQRDADPYRVWVSEIMLQQTQVATVIGYFERFMDAFPDIPALAAAPVDEVLHLWSGLGYYARARNLHRAAQHLVADHRGWLPDDLDALRALPGIGRSTAGAILALAHGQRQPILDGNVRRVLARYHAVEGWPGRPAVERRLWALADAHTPSRQVATYTQAIMDLGATVCTRRQPRCDACPLAAGCAALRASRIGELPSPRPRRARPTRATAMLVAARDDGAVLLERRPAKGVWGGLWSLPEFDPAQSPADVARALGLAPCAEASALAPLRHAFTHFELAISPHLLRVAAGGVADAGGDRVWYKPGHSQPLGLPAPVSRLLYGLHGECR